MLYRRSVLSVVSGKSLHDTLGYEAGEAAQSLENWCVSGDDYDLFRFLLLDGDVSAILDEIESRRYIKSGQDDGQVMLK